MLSYLHTNKGAVAIKSLAHQGVNLLDFHRWSGVLHQVSLGIIKQQQLTQLLLHFELPNTLYVNIAILRV